MWQIKVRPQAKLATKATLDGAIFLLFCLLTIMVTPELINATRTGMFIFFSYGISVITLLGVIGLVIGRVSEVRLTRLDLLLLALVLYIGLNRYFIQPLHGFSVKSYELGGLCMLYIVLRNLPKAFPYLLLAVVMSGTIQAVYGILQLLGYYPSYHFDFMMTGSFFNPGPYAGFLACVFPVALGMYLFGNTNLKLKVPEKFRLYALLGNSLGSALQVLRRSIRRISERYIPVLGIISILLVIPASRSRAAWLAVLFSSLYLVFMRFDVKNWILTFVNTSLRRTASLAFIVVFISGILAVLYFLRRDSADGRLLVWSVTASMFVDNFAFGVGFDRFKAHYMNGQALHFQKNLSSEDTIVADNVYYAFNEPLQFIAENGIVGFVILVGGVIWLLKSSKLESREAEYPLILIATAGLISSVSFSLFSYPGEILPIKVCTVMFLAMIANSLSVFCRLHLFQGRDLGWLLRSCIVLVFFFAASALWAQIGVLRKGYVDWRAALTTYQWGDYLGSLASYQKAYPMFKKDGEFLMNYGKALSMAGKHEEAVKILNEARNFLSSTIIQTALGDSYKALKDYERAEEAYWQAWWMVPNRFYPKYLLARMYDELGNKEGAVTIARELLEKEVKVESTAIKEIKAEMQKIIIANKNKSSS